MPLFGLFGLGGYHSGKSRVILDLHLNLSGNLPPVDDPVNCLLCEEVKSPFTLSLGFFLNINQHLVIKDVKSSKITERRAIAPKKSLQGLPLTENICYSKVISLFSN